MAYRILVPLDGSELAARANHSRWSPLQAAAITAEGGKL
jgi:hypothetical protein